MLWCNVLDLYYAADQPEDILHLVADRCYRPLAKSLLASPEAHLTVNVDSALLERFEEHGMGDVTDALGQLVECGRIELTGSAARHALLTTLDRDQAQRAIEEHQRVLDRFFGALYKPAGFFPPELSYTPALGPLLAEAGFRWVLVDETAAVGLEPTTLHQCVYQVAGAGGLAAVIRDRGLSTGILYRGFTTPSDFLEAVGPAGDGSGYLVTATAAEVYGYHHAGYHEFLAAAMCDGRFQTSTISGLLDRCSGRRPAVQLKQSSWSPWATLQY